VDNRQMIFAEFLWTLNHRACVDKGRKLVIMCVILHDSFNWEIEQKLSLVCDLRGKECNLISS